MKRRAATLCSALAAILSLSCNLWYAAKPSGNSTSDKRESSSKQSSGCGPSDRLQNYQYARDVKANEVRDPKPGYRVSFQDKTAEIVSQAQRIIETNQKEGAVLDQRWYSLKYFDKHQELILNAATVTFFGGRENDVRNHLSGRYISINPIEENQDSGDIRMYIGERTKSDFDFIVIGQNGNEVALKTIIRLLYLRKFVDDKTKQKYRDKLASFTQSLQVLLSSVSPRDEFIKFFNRHGIDRSDAVIIGFRGDVRSLMKDDGISDPESYSDESLRVNCYPDANGKRVLLVSIDKNRIFASRAGELIEALLLTSPPARSPLSITFLGSGGAIDARQMVGQIVTPISVLNGDSYVASSGKAALVHLIRNSAADGTAPKTADVTVETVVAETTQWARKMKDLGISTVDQELFHIMNAINSSPYANRIHLYVGTLVTDNVSSKAQDNDTTLEHAEEIISATADVRRAFLYKILQKMGVLKKDASRNPREPRSEDARPLGLRGG